MNHCHYIFKGMKIAFACAMLLLLCGPMMAQTGKAGRVTGRVTDENGETIVGATVMIQGTRTGTSTNNDGMYEISAKPSDILVFTCIGYSIMQVEVGKRAVINVTLMDDIEKLQETVVTGYQTLSKERRPVRSPR